MRIYQLNLKSRDIKAMKEFYTSVLEMNLVDETDSYFAIMAGTTKIVYEKVDQLPHYHVCFRTNSQYFDAIFAKIEKEDILLPDENGEYLLDWKGKQAYFTDPDGNILEIIERPFDYKGVPEPIGWFDVSEIGLPTPDVKKLQESLDEYIQDQYKANHETFAFYGDPNSAFVIVKEGRPWYPTNRSATIHPVKIFVSGNHNINFKHSTLPYEFIIKKEWNDQLSAVQFRMARPTNQLDKLVQFYEEGIGLKKIGEFKNHDGYDGIMLGLPNSSYHLEFTQSEEIMNLPNPTKEHLFVLYIPNLFQRNRILEQLGKMGYVPTEPENPYWGCGGVTIEDPDGWRVVLMNSSGI